MSNRFLTAAFAAVVAFALTHTMAQAQLAVDPAMLSQLTPQDRAKALQALQGGGLETSDAPSAPALVQVPTRPVSAAEVGAGDERQLPLFGYSLFSGGGNTFSPIVFETTSSVA